MLIHPEISVSVHTMLVSVESFELFRFGNPNANGLFQNEQNDKGGSDADGGIREHANQLTNELIHTCQCSEDTDSEGAPDTADQVNCYGSHGIIQPDFVHKGYGEYDQCPSDSTDDDGIGRTHLI